MKIKSLLILTGLAFSLQSHAKNESDQTIGVSTSTQDIHLTFDLANQKDENVIGLKGEYPLSQNARALEHFKDKMGQSNGSVELYGVVDLGYRHSTK